MPHRKSLALNWRRLAERYKFAGNRCVTCSTVYFPPRMVCPKCRRKGKLEAMRLTGEGEIYSYTTVRVPPEGYEFGAPYVLAMIKLKEGPFITGQVSDIKPEEVSIGMPVKAVFRRICEDGEDGAIHYAFKFVKA
jgi:hypothetical protein